MKPSAIMLTPLLWLSGAAAQTPPESPPATEPLASETPANAADVAPRAPVAKFSLDTPIAELIADRRAKAAIDKHLPGLSFDKNLDKFSAMSLRQLQPQSGGRLTDALMEQVGADLAAIE